MVLGGVWCVASVHDNVVECGGGVSCMLVQVGLARACGVVGGEG